MGIFIFLMFIWLIYIQIKLNDIADKFENKSTNFSSFDNYKETRPEVYNQISQQQKIQTQNLLSNNIEEESNNEYIRYKNTSSKPFDFENIFLGNIFNKIGAIALIIGIIIFIKLISPYIVFTPAMKISTGYLAGILMSAFAFRISEDKMKNYKETLLGTGISTLFITTYCASVLFKIFTPPVASILGTLILVGVFILADKQKTVSMIAIALIAGYLNPLLTGGNISNEFLFGYYIFLNLLSIVYVYRNPHRDIINFINLLITFTTLSLVLTINNSPINIVYPLVLWLIYLGYDILRKEKVSLETDKNNILNWVNFGILAAFTMFIFKEQKAYAGYLLLSTCLVYTGLIIRYFKQKTDAYKPYLYSALIIILIITYLLSDGIYRISLWAFDGVIIALTASRNKLSFLGNWALMFIIAAVTSLLLMDNIIYFSNINEYTPIINIRTLGFLILVCATFIIYREFKTTDDKKLINISNICRFSFISLIYLYITFELTSYMHRINLWNYDRDFVTQMLLSVVGFKYALQMKRIHNSSNFRLFEIMSYAIGIASLITILLFGFTYKPLSSFVPVINLRFLAYISSIISVIFFAKWTKLDLFKYLAVMMGFILIHIETLDFINSTTITNIDWLLTLMWLIYAGIITLAGIFKNTKYLKNTGIWISILAILRIYIYDLADTSMMYKLIAFMSLGIILMIISYFYNKKK